MAAIARIEYGLAEGEFWRLTPRQFQEYAKRYSELERRRWQPFRFLATVTARAWELDVDYMEEPEAEEQVSNPDAFEAWITARAKADAKGGSTSGLIAQGDGVSQPTGDSAPGQLLNGGEEAKGAD